MESESLGRANANHNNFCNWIREQNEMRIKQVVRFIFLLTISCLIRNRHSGNKTKTLVRRIECWSLSSVSGRSQRNRAICLLFRFALFDLPTIDIIVCACVSVNASFANRLRVFPTSKKYRIIYGLFLFDLYLFQASTNQTKYKNIFGVVQTP